MKHTALPRVQERLRELGAVQASETEWHCPNKDNHRNGDKRPSLTVRYGDAAQNKVILACAGCGGADVLLPVLGMTKADLLDDDLKTTKREGLGEWRRTDHFEYTDEQGQPLFRLVKKRYANGTKVLQKRPNRRGVWVSRRPEQDGKALMYGIRRPLYRLPEVIYAVKNGWEIHLTEGESDADALNDWFTDNGVEARATCHPGGAGKWQQEHTDTLAGAGQVVVWADRDGPGYACAHQRLVALLAADLKATARLPRVDPPLKDVRDHLASGLAPHDGQPVKKKALAKLAGDAKETKPAPITLAHPVRTWDDYGMADRVVDRYADRIRRINDAEKWAVYQGGAWILRNAEDQIRGLIRKTTEVLPEQERDAYPVEDRETFDKWVKGRRKSSADGATLQTLRTKKTIFASINDFDRSGDNCLNCRNGVLDLDALTLAPHSPAHYFTRQTTADFIVGAEDKDWQEFLELALPDEECAPTPSGSSGWLCLTGTPASCSSSCWGLRTR